ncbi:transglutaminase domain-containing protein [Solitalea lacus]|uniref:transglutaminase domain-containing protein n=1 Tax=Solitalea lacus TaxID=2911172 RepID=UPI001EDC58B0|nr:transglutaminase domain-containing protein [Solitalea lacus]UKJ08581.1 hypothetical protein L2B55_05300 [Solitalea lacus]
MNRLKWAIVLGGSLLQLQGFAGIYPAVVNGNISCLEKESKIVEQYNYPKPKTLQEMSDLLSNGIKSLTKTIYFDVSAMNMTDNQLKITVLNAYYDALNKDNSLKYAYKVVPTRKKGTKIFVCEIKYMPYKLGINPKTVPAGAKKINSYNDIITATLNSPLGKNIPIAITNKDLDFTTLQLVLGSNSGYGYLVYMFNADGTSITCAPAPKGLPGAPTSISDCISKINTVKDSVTAILTRIITPDMTNDQKLTTIYNYVTRTSYDFNFNTPKLPFDSQTAYGVFVNRKAVCGGYSWAFNLLANAAGIQCYNVGGKGDNVTHAWSLANYNGGYYYFDSTWDRGLNQHPYKYFGQTESYFQSKRHVWNNTMINALVAEKQQGVNQ